MQFICYVHLVLLIELFLEINGRPYDIEKTLFSNHSKINTTTIIQKKNLLGFLHSQTTKDNDTETKTHPIVRSVTETDVNGTASNKKREILFPDDYDENTDITFPDDVSEPISRILGTPNCAVGTVTFCEDFDPYPQQHVNNVLQSHTVEREFFYEKDEQPRELEERMDASEEKFFCGVIRRIIFPKIGKNRNDEWKYIVNQGIDDGFVQGIFIESCRNEGGRCDVIQEPSGYRSSCKQKYIYRRLLSLNDDGTPVPDTFVLPSACCCSYKRDFDFLARYGSPLTEIK